MDVFKKLLTKALQQSDGAKGVGAAHPKRKCLSPVERQLDLDPAELEGEDFYSYENKFKGPFEAAVGSGYGLGRRELMR